MSDTDDIGLNARLAALSLIAAAHEKRGGLDEAGSAKAFLSLSDGERAFARALALIVLRRWGQFSYVIEKMTQKKPPEPVAALLRIGFAQIGFMQVPDFAAVSTTVKLAERDSKTRPYKGLINAILRGAIREKRLANIEAKRLVPDWLLARWKTAYGEAEALNIAAQVTQEPATDLSFKTREALEAATDALEGTSIGGLTLRSALRGDVSRWAGYDAGDWWVQDASAAIAVNLLGDISGKTAIDLCAAPGGKTMQMAAAGAKVVALDRSKNRIKRIEENLTRTGLSAEVHLSDAESFDDARTFDVVLLDAPCSSTGTFRRQPDVLWATRPADIAKLADVQHRLLDAAVARTAAGGSLVYCVCSLERDEGETQILAFLRRHKDFSLKAPDATTIDRLGLNPASVGPEGWLRLLPHQREGGQDGFFVAHLVRG